MKKFLPKKLSRLLPVAALAVAGLYAPLASALPAMGFDATGTGTFGLNPNAAFATTWTNQTDSALSVGYNPLLNVPIPNAPYVVDLVAQAKVGSMQLGATTVTPIGMNVINGAPSAAVFDSLGWERFELTKVLRLQELVVTQDGFGTGFSVPKNVSFGMTAQTSDVDSAQGGNQQLAIYFDNITDGSQAISSSGPGTVKCYGAGSTSGAANGCTNDGTLILSAHLISSISSFTATSFTEGTGGFDLTFMIDYVNTNYLDIATNSIIKDRLSGKLIAPPTLNPAQMWDGTGTGTGVLFDVDSSETFLQAVPEPGSLALVGISLFGLGLSLRRQRRG